MKPASNRIVITGIAPICSLGVGREEVWESVVRSRLNLVKHTYKIGSDVWEDYYLHKIKDFNINDFDLPKQSLDFVLGQRGFKREDRDLHYFLATVKLAIKDSGIKYDHEDNDIGLVLTHENPGMESFFEDVVEGAYQYLAKGAKEGAPANRIKLTKELYDNCEESGYSLQTFSYLYSVAKVFDIHGFSLFVNNACASGLFAIDTAAGQLRSGRNSAVIVAACDNPTKVYKYEWFKKKGLYAKDGKTKPFSNDEGGIVFGDGGAAIVLETLESARKRGARIYGEYLGGGFTLEGWKITVPDVSHDFYARSFTKALADSGAKPEDIDFVNPHGVGMKVTDTYEAKTIRSVFGEMRPPVSAFKPMVGHNLGGSALLETALSLLSLDKQLIPATLNCENENAKLGLNIAKRHTEKKMETIAKMSCGFAGFNGVAIFKKIKE